MSDTELLALIAIVNAQTAELNLEIEQARQNSRDTPSWGNYDRSFVDRLKRELNARKAK